MDFFVYNLDDLDQMMADLSRSGSEASSETGSEQSDSEDSEISWILDIDLDMFSCFDPFLKILGQENFDALCQIYEINCFSDENQLKSLREDQKIDQILQQQDSYAEKFSQTSQKLKKFWKSPEKLESTSDSYHKFLIKNCQNLPLSDQNLPEHNLDLVLAAAETLVLPNYVSSDVEIEAMMQKFSAILKKFGQIFESEPKFIGIARSSYDEYCPQNQVEKIEKLAFQQLEKLYGQDKLRKIFDEDA